MAFIGGGGAIRAPPPGPSTPIPEIPVHGPG